MRTITTSAKVAVEGVRVWVCVGGFLPLVTEEWHYIHCGGGFFERGSLKVQVFWKNWSELSRKGKAV